MAQKFFGLEVSAQHKVVTANPPPDRKIVITQVALVAGERVSLVAHVDGEKFVIGTLGEFPHNSVYQIATDLVFETQVDFSVWNHSKTAQSDASVPHAAGCIHLTGYTVPLNTEASPGGSLRRLDSKAVYL